jgi:hypothetical protein
MQDEPLVTDYVGWLYTEVTSLLEVFVGVHENFISVVVEGTLVMARGLHQPYYLACLHH